MLEKVNGMIIKTQDYGETNKIVTIFSQRYGKFSAIARGAKKTKSRMAAVTQPFIYGEFLIYMNKGLSAIQQGDVIESFRPIREDILKTAYAAYIAELTDKLLDVRQPDLYIYDQFFRTIHWIAAHDNADISVMMYELKLFGKGGFAPTVNWCAQCGRKENLTFFSLMEGGLLCDQCAFHEQSAIQLPVPVAKLLYVFSNLGIERVGKISIKPENTLLLREILDAYYDQYGGFYLKSRRVLKQLKP